MDFASKCLPVTSSNALFCMHYVDNLNYHFPLTSMGKCWHVRNLITKYSFSSSPPKYVLSSVKRHLCNGSGAQLSVYIIIEYLYWRILDLSNFITCRGKVNGQNPLVQSREHGGRTDITMLISHTLPPGEDKASLNKILPVV